MSWNDRLYMYAQERGGEYFGGVDELLLEEDAGGDGVLLLEYKGATLMVKCRKRRGKYSYSHTAQVQLCCQLEREFSLSISAKNAVNKGLNAVLGGFGGKQDYGFPEVTTGRRIKTDDKEFTRMVLQDLELRNILQANPRFELHIRKCAPDCAQEPRHMIRAECEMDPLMNTAEGVWDIEDVDQAGLSPEQQLAVMKRGNFSTKLDQLIRLAQAAHGAVTTWRMPAKPVEVKK